MKSFLLGTVLTLSLLLLASPALADGVAVQYTAVDLGSGAWQYEYTLQGSFLANWGVAIYFPTPNYVGGLVTDLGTGDPDFWLTFSFSADSNLPAPGEYDIVALVDNPSLSSVFDVTFQWDGTGTPGSQAFNLYDFTNVADADLLASGTTTAAASTAVPEPTPLLLLLFAGFAWLTVLTIRRLS